MIEYFIRVEAPHFVAALIIRDGKIVETALILKWSLGKPWNEVFSYFKRKNYVVIETVLSHT